MKRAAGEQPRDPGQGSPSPDERGDQEQLDSKPEPKREEERPTKQARRFSQSVDTAWASQSASEGNVTKDGDDEAAHQYAKKPHLPEQPTIDGEEGSKGGTTAGAPPAVDDSKLSAILGEGAPGTYPTAVAFPAQLMDLLQRNVAPDALWFLEGGEAIGINRDKIADKVLNEHFRGMKFNSLVRNLNRWGFRRISHQALREKERGFHHLLFQRDRPHLLHRMKRDSNAKEVVRQLDLEEGKDEVQSDSLLRRDGVTGASETKSEVNPTPVSLAQSTQSSRQQLEGGAGAMRNFPALYGAPAQRQQLIWQSLAVQQQLDWQRQQASLAQLGAAPSMWGATMSNWNNQLPLPQAAPFAASLQQQGMPPATSLRPSQVPTIRTNPGVGSEEPSAGETKEAQDPQEDPEVDFDGRGSS